MNPLDQIRSSLTDIRDTLANALERLRATAAPGWSGPSGYVPEARDDIAAVLAALRTLADCAEKAADDQAHLECELQQRRDDLHAARLEIEQLIEEKVEARRREADFAKVAEERHLFRQAIVQFLRIHDGTGRLSWGRWHDLNQGAEELRGVVAAVEHPSWTGEHTEDAHCRVSPETDFCEAPHCGVHHGDPCSECGRRAFNVPGCSLADGADVVRLRIDATRKEQLQTLINVCRVLAVGRTTLDLGRDPEAAEILKTMPGAKTWQHETIGRVVSGVEVRAGHCTVSARWPSSAAVELRVDREVA